MINRWKELARFALMHSMGTSLFFWFSMILRETMHSLQHKIIEDHKDLPHIDDHTSPVSQVAANSSGESLIHWWIKSWSFVGWGSIICLTGSGWLNEFFFVDWFLINTRRVFHKVGQHVERNRFESRSMLWRQQFFGSYSACIALSLPVQHRVQHSCWYVNIYIN